LISSCLVKDPKQRLRDIGDARIALERIASGTTDEAETAATPASAGSTARTRAMTLVAVGAVIAVVAAGATWLATRQAPAPPPPVAHFVTPLPIEALPVRGNGAGIAVSPDGTMIVYAAQPALLTSSVLYRRKLNALDVEKLPNTEGGYAPFFSPDGKWIGFFTDTSVMRLSLDGGSFSKICNRGRFSRAAWAPDDTIILGTSVAYAPGALGKVPASGGEPVPLTALQGKETLHQLPHVLPDGRHVVFTIISPAGYALAIAPIAGGAHTLLNLEGSGALFVAPNHLLFARGDAILTVGFDPRTNEVHGTPSQLLDDAAIFATNAVVLFPLLGADAAGSIAYLNKDGSAGRLRWLTGTGAVVPIPDATYGGLSLSPDGRRVAVTLGATPPDVWTIDLDRGTRLRLTSGGANAAVWSPDGSRIAYWHPVSGLMTIASDGSGSPEVFSARPENTVLFPSAWTRDGQAIVVTAEDRGAGRGTRNRDILLVRRGAKPAPLVATPSDERGGVVSPDGRWLAYASSVSGREEVYVRPLDGAGATVPVSSDGGTLPRWPSADSLLYLSAKGVMRARVRFNPLQIGAPEQAAAVAAAVLGGADATADGRILAIEQRSDAGARDMVHVLLNWGPSLR
jgi:serine/threonine-protein kinase